MEIGILTYYNVHNHGAVLQAYALKSVLECKGHTCGFLEFQRDYSNIPNQQTNKYRLGLGSIVFYAKYLVQKGPGNIFYNIGKKRTLDAFRRQYIPMIGRYEDFSGDLAIIGSDEVFSLEIGVNPFLYGNGLNARHVISYAGCFGPTVYEEVLRQGQQNMIAEGLGRMDVISVRDTNSQETVRKICGIDAILVCDPVILYGYEKEICAYQPPIEDYILIYAYDKNLNDPTEYEEIQRYARKRGLKVVSVGYYHPWCKSINAAPVELLGWIKHASLVVTDTFHGAVLSILCNTPLAVKLRGNQNKLGFLLQEYGLQGRILSDFAELGHIADQKTEFDTVNRIVRERRAASMKVLDDALEGCK